MNSDIFWALIFIAAMIIIGLFSSRKVKSFDDFSVSGHNMHFFLLFATLACTVIGGATTMGFVGLVDKIGCNFLWVVVAIVLSNLFSGWFLAAPIRRLQIRSVGDLYRHFYGESTMHIANIVALVTTVLLFGVQLTGMGNILSVLTGWPLQNCIIFSTAIMLLYTWAGGIKAVARTDFLQFLFICTGLGCTIAIGLEHIDGIRGLVNVLSVKRPSSLNLTGNLPFSVLSGLFLTFFLGGILSPSMVQRYASSKSEQQARKGVLLFAIFFLIFGVVIVLLGLMVSTIADLPLAQHEKELIALMKYLLPPWLYGLGLAAIFAAVMSTADSFLNTSSIIFVKVIQHNATDQKKLLILARISTLVIGVSGLTAALVKPEILGLVKYTFAIWAPCMLPAMLPVLMKRDLIDKASFSTPAANCSMIAGITVMIVFQALAIKEIFHIPVIVIGLIISTTFLLLINQIFPGKELSTRSETF